MIKIIKYTVNSVVVYIWDENIEADKIILWSKIQEDDRKKIGELEYSSQQIEYKFDGFANFVDYNVDDFPFEIEFVKNEEVIRHNQITTTNFRLKPFQRGVYKTKRYEFYIKAKNVNGMRFLVFKKQNKYHCPVCWDDDYNSSNNSNCPECKGTGYIDKYSKPFFTYGFYLNDEPISATETTESGKQPLSQSLGNSAMIKILPDVLLSQSDLVYAIDIGDASIVHTANVTLFNNNPISQSASISSLPTDSNAFKSIESDLQEKLKEVYGGIK